MANNKTYTVMKDGKELKELKTLVSAKKLADAEGAEVLSEGECVYQGTVSPYREDEHSQGSVQDGGDSGYRRKGNSDRCGRH